VILFYGTPPALTHYVAEIMRLGGIMAERSNRRCRQVASDPKIQFPLHLIQEYIYDKIQYGYR
jgi:hypothetical protein